MKIIVIGTVNFSLEMLEIMHQQGADLVGVITGDDTGINSDYADLVPFCENNGISCYKCKDINAHETVEWIKSKGADIIFCLGWSRLIKSQVLQAASLGVIGYHPAALPKNRGRHPLIWALVLGLEKTASTFFFMDEGTDSGDILSQEEITISADDDAKTLYVKMVETAIQQMQSMIPALENGNYNRIPQDHSFANTWRKRGIKDGIIDWRMSAQSIYDLIRGLTRPYVGANFVCNGLDYKVWKSRVVDIDETDNLEPGKVLKVDSKVLTVKCGEKCIELLEIDPIPNLSTGAYL